jgi:hypothetical protein
VIGVDAAATEAHIFIAFLAYALYVTLGSDCIRKPPA